MPQTPGGQADARAILFFPGNRTELLSKALGSRAARVCMDLEDAVPAHAKDEARAAARSTLSRNDAAFDRLVIRINHPATVDGMKDLEEIAATASAAVCIMVPKVTAAEDIEAVRAPLSMRGAEPALIPVIETARGLAAVEEIAAAPSVAAILFGGLDLSIDLGCALDWEALLYARSRTVHAARLGGVEAVDMPFLDLSDADGLRLEAARARRLGFTAKAAIHPSQIDVIDEVFTPTEAELEHARRVVEAFDRDGSGVFLLDGTMIDRPAIEAARLLLSRVPAEED